MFYKTGDLFTSEQDAIGHGVNCRGLMGAGIAAAFRKRYQKNYEEYHTQCTVRGLTPGGVFITVDVDPGFEGPRLFDERIIVNMASQDKPGSNATYRNLFNSADNAARQLRNIGIQTLAIPQIGCGIGGLDWERVETILAAVEDIHDNYFNFEVWSL